MAAHTSRTLLRRLSAAGFQREFARVAVLPDWWEPACEKDASLLTELEIRVARFIGAPLAVVRDPDAVLAAPAYGGAKLRRVRDIGRDRLAPAIHAALSVAGAVVRTASLPELRLPPTTALEWRRQITPNAVVGLEDVLRDLWERGIPVVHIEKLPVPTFQGLACIVSGRPVIVLAHDLDQPARICFIVVHEAAHLVFGDCAPEQPVVDENEEFGDVDAIEVRADAYAAELTTGGADIPDVAAAGYKELAQKAIDAEQDRGVDATAVIWAWARRTGDYGKAQMAAEALYRTKGGKRLLRSHLDAHLDLARASESDRALLACLHGDPDRDGAAG